MVLMLVYGVINVVAFSINAYVRDSIEEVFGVEVVFIMFVGVVSGVFVGLVLSFVCGLVERLKMI